MLADPLEIEPNFAEILRLGYQRKILARYSTYTPIAEFLTVHQARRER
jgi:hypothetical protein